MFSTNCRTAFFLTPAMCGRAVCICRFFGDANQVPADLLGPGNAQLQRPYPQYQSINENLENGISNYNAFVFTLKREFSQGLLFTVNYTWSKSMDTQTVSNWSWR